MKRLITNYFLALLLSAFAWEGTAKEATIASEGNTWVLENDVASLTINYSPTSGVRLDRFYGKEAARTLAGEGSELFHYMGRYIPVQEGLKGRAFAYKASDGEWQLMGSSVERLTLNTAGHRSIGQQLTLRIQRDSLAIDMVFQVYDGRSGLRYQTFLTNLCHSQEVVVEQGDVIALDVPVEAHHTHYVTNSAWLSTTGALATPSVDGRGNDVAKCAITLYDGDRSGWYLAPETNWKTQYGPETFGKQETPSYRYELRPFATLNWETEQSQADGSPAPLRVSLSPESFQLVLFPEETFELIAVNLTAFRGDILDGKMAVEEHLRKRFRYHDTTTSLMINDWEWFRNGYRTVEYFRDIVLPKAQKAGYDLLLIDDGWNNSTPDGRWITDSGTSRDPIESNTPGIPDMAAFASMVRESGLRLGLWYSNSGGGHNKGNDLADPEVVAKKKELIEIMIRDYGLTHQAVDLTQYWQNLTTTSYSHPSDNVYRKNVLARRMMNEIVAAHPDYEFKVTSELDLYPNPADRMTELLHLPDNGWMTITGFSKPVDVMPLHFGHLPLNAAYLGSGGDPSAKADELYAMLSGRDVKAWDFPSSWSDEGIRLMGLLNSWRKGSRVRRLTDGVVRPVWMGKGCTSDDASDWQPRVGPYVWMYADEAKDEAFVIATCGGRTLTEPPTSYPLRWLDEDKTYVVSDVTLDDTGIFTYAYKGCFTGRQLNTTGLDVNLYENTSPAKAYWLHAVTDSEAKQVVFADENVQEWTSTTSGSTLHVDAIGTPDTQGTVIVYGNDDAMTCCLHFDAQGEASLDVAAIENNDVPYPGEDNTTYRLEFEDYHSGLEKSTDGIKVNTFDNGNPDNEHGYSSVCVMTAEGDYVVYNMSIPFAGTYRVQLNYKLSRSYRGTAQFSYVAPDGTETLLGDPIDESTTGDEQMVTADLGTLRIATAGPLRIKMKLVGGGQSGTGTYIGANYVTLTRETAYRLEFEDYHSGLEKSTDGIKVNTFDNGNPDSEHGYSSVCIMTAVGDYVVYNMSIPFAGTYRVQLNYKLSRSYRGTAQFSYVAPDGTETLLGDPIDESTTGDEQMVTADLGTLRIATAGPLRIKMKLVGGGQSGTGTYIGANYVTFTKQ